MSHVSEYRERAAECIALASRSKSRPLCLWSLQMAQTFRHLADLVERNEEDSFAGLNKTAGSLLDYANSNEEPHHGLKPY